MVAAGLDTLPSNLNMTIAYLSSPHGQDIQARAYDEVMKTYPDGDGWHACLEGETCEYMVALVKETLRFWSTINLSITRQSVKPIDYKGVTFPAGTPFVMVGVHKLWFHSLLTERNRITMRRIMTLRISKTPTIMILSAISECQMLASNK